MTSDRSPRLTHRLRIFAPLGVLVLVLAGATTAFASGTFDAHASGFDSPRDVIERGTAPQTTPTTSSLATTPDDHGVDPPQATNAPTVANPAPTQAPAVHDLEPNDVDDDDFNHRHNGGDDNSGPGSARDNSGPGNHNDDS